ncbi:hypothetical protein M1534_01370, partial [Patescibacteria group bacterium]|nr:hypothetical protein [Patescibacteria group bacterium]
MEKKHKIKKILLYISIIILLLLVALILYFKKEVYDKTYKIGNTIEQNGIAITITGVGQYMHINSLNSFFNKNASPDTYEVINMQVTA